VALLWLLTYLLILVTLARQGDNAPHGAGRRTDGQDARRRAAGSFPGGTDRVAACRVSDGGFCSLQSGALGVAPRGTGGGPPGFVAVSRIA
jgi:hypothetical protein